MVGCGPAFFILYNGTLNLKGIHINISREEECQKAVVYKVDNVFS